MFNKNNPFSLKNVTNKILESCIQDKKRLDKIKAIPQSQGLVMLIENIEKVISNGFTILEVVEDEFNSNVSRKTIENMLIKNINMPFKNFCIKFKESENKDKTIFISNEENRVVFSKEDDKGILSCIIEKDDEDIKLTLDIYAKESVEMILDSLSIIMYFTTFKNEKNRVNFRKIENKNRLTKNISKTVSIINLETNYFKNKHEKSEPKIHDKSWLVKGHWRNQFYSTEEAYKPKWIDCYWKGDSKEIMNKIYKITNKKGQF